MVNNTTHDSSIKDVSNSDTKPDADESRLPVTRRSVLKGAASIGPVAGLVGSGVAADEASAAQGKGHDAGPVTVQSPDENIKATIKQRSPNRIDDDLPPGRVVSLTVSRDGTRVLDPSPLGLKTYTGQFVTSLSLEAQDVRTIEHTFETVGGDQAGEQTIHARFATLVYGSPSGVMKIDLLVSNEGIAYRYRLPGDGHVIVAGEASAFQIPEDSAGWLLPYTDKYEKVWEEKDAKSASGDFGFPCLFKVGDDTYTLLTEANVGGRYCASHVAVDNPKSGTPAIGAKQDRDEIVGGNEEIDYDRNPYLFELRFAGTYGLPEMVTASLPLTTPWRVALAGNLSSVVDSNLVAALNEPSKIDDTSWIKHGRTDWSWWSNGDSPRSLEIQKKYVDYAAELGWEYTLVDRGWRREWMPELVEYANERDVGILAWLPWYYLNDDVKRERVLSRMKEFGVSGIKVDYMNADLQQRMEWYDQVLEATARHKLMVNFHGSTVPKGRRRTWPHLMTSEAIRGAENEGFGPMPASHDAIIPFTRNVVGPMDYTPVTFSAHGTAPATDRPAHELALSVVYQSDWQHFADSIESYRDHPLAEEFLSKVAAVWDETHLINGHPAEKATFARRDGDQWFVGNIVAGHGRTVDVPLSFIKENQQFTAQIIGNSGSGLEERKKNIDSTDTLSIEVQSDGGFVAYLNPCN